MLVLKNFFSQEYVKNKFFFNFKNCFTLGFPSGVGAMKYLVWCKYGFLGKFLVKEIWTY